MGHGRIEDFFSTAVAVIGVGTVAHRMVRNWIGRIVDERNQHTRDDVAEIKGDVKGIGLQLKVITKALFNHVRHGEPVPEYEEILAQIHAGETHEG